MKIPALLVVLLLTIPAGDALAASGVETSATWRFLELHAAPKPSALLPPPQSATLRASCGDVNAVEWRCPEAGPALQKYRATLEARWQALEKKLGRMALYPQAYDGTDFQLALTQSGLSKEQIPPALQRKIKSTRFAVAWRGSPHNRPREPYFPY